MRIRSFGALAAAAFLLCGAPSLGAAQSSCGYCYQCEGNPYAAGTYCGCILCHNNKDCIPGCIWGWCSDLVPCDGFGGGFAAAAKVQSLTWQLARADGSRMSALLATYPGVLGLDLERRTVELRDGCEGRVVLIPISSTVDVLLLAATWVADQAQAQGPLQQVIRPLVRTGRAVATRPARTEPAPPPSSASGG